MKLVRVPGVVLACVLGVGLAHPAAAQRKPSIAIMPSQYFSATAESADALTQGLSQQFEGKGYTVVDPGKARSTFQSLNLGTSQHYADREALRFGRSIGSDLVAYPRLLAVGIPAAATQGTLLEPAAVIHLRVLNVHTGGAIYFRQIAHEFNVDASPSGGTFNLPGPIATAGAGEVLEIYFRTIAGSRRETRGAR
jgi:hypothetical protein